MRDTVEAVGREGGATDHAWVVGHSVKGQRSGATGGVVGGEAAVRRTTGVGCSGVFVLYLLMGMGEIHWREEVDPIGCLP